jgi:hypothetical protein
VFSQCTSRAPACIAPSSEGESLGVCGAVVQRTQCPDPCSAHHGRFPLFEGGVGEKQLTNSAHDNGCTPRSRATITPRTTIPQESSSDSDTMTPGHGMRAWRAREVAQRYYPIRQALAPLRRGRPIKCRTGDDPSRSLSKPGEKGAVSHPGKARTDQSNRDDQNQNPDANDEHISRAPLGGLVIL